MRVVVDTEWNGWDLEKCWCIVFRDIDTDAVTSFEYPINEPDLKKFTAGITLWVGHNLLGFDRPALLTRFPSLVIPLDACQDTLVVSKYLNQNIQGGHSLEAWGQRLKRPGEKLLDKIQIEDFSVYTPELFERCVSDTAINKRLYQHFLRWTDRPEFKDSLITEHRTAYLCRVLHDTGFALDVPKTRGLFERLSARLSELNKALEEAFPPKQELDYVLVPRQTASGAIHAVDLRRALNAGYNLAAIEPGKPLEIFKTVVFDPNSLKQVIDRLWDAGWQPTDKTKGHIEALKSKKPLERFNRYGWKLSDENLLTLPDTAPAATKLLTERLMISSRVKVVEAWLNIVRETGRIHGNFTHIGAWTGRLSHSDPNMANVPKVQDDAKTELELLSNEINEIMRSCWIAPPGRRLVGVDADGIQMRIFAHYVNDKRLTEALINGSKENKTDIHSVHWRALGEACRGRDPAKRFIYAWLLGAGNAKVAEILQCSVSQAKTAVSSFLEFYPGLKELKRTTIPTEAKRGFFIGLDGRPVVCDDAHLVLAGYLQSGESVIMKRAMWDWYTRLTNEGVDFKLVNFVHDEWQVEVPDDPAVVEYVMGVMSDAIAKQGDELKLNCPLAGSGTSGYNWMETH